jgi:NADH-ubiquinone oxidoreductase-F iron-sulfur binding region
VVVEVPYGVRLGDLLGLAGADPAAAGTLLVGGYHGGWLPADPGLAAAVSREGLAPWQAAPGASVVVVLCRQQCGLAASARILGYLARQSAGQCGPCLNGLPALAGTLARLAAGERNPRLPAEVHRLAALVDGRGACHHPDGSVRMLRSAMRTFGGDVQAHLAGWCTVQAGRAPDEAAPNAGRGRRHRPAAAPARGLDGLRRPRAVRRAAARTAGPRRLGLPDRPLRRRHPRHPGTRRARLARTAGGPRLPPAGVAAVRVPVSTAAAE